MYIYSGFIDRVMFKSRWTAESYFYIYLYIYIYIYRYIYSISRVYVCVKNVCVYVCVRVCVSLCVCTCVDYIGFYIKYVLFVGADRIMTLLIFYKSFTYVFL